jgi:thiol-disulfide isomerase/thioredoxin
MNFIKRSDAFKRIKSDLTQGWVTGGILSILGSIFIFFLIISEFSAYLSVRTLSEVQMSDNMDAQVRININISMPRLPCQFASLDVKDVIGTNKMNITTNIRKWKLKGKSGDKRIAEMNDNVIAPKHEEEDKHPEDPVDKAQMLSNGNFNTFVQSNELVLVNFYAPWCHWSRRLMPTWHNLASVVSKKPYGYNTKIAMVDCTHADSVQTCRQAHINAFPMVAVYRGNINTHQYYHGDRTTEKFVQFIENIRSQTNHDSVHKALGFKTGPGVQIEANAHHAGPEGCLIQGFVMVNKVPGSLAIAAHSKHHTIAASLINTTHSIHHFSFGDVPPKRSYGLLKGAYEAANK